MSIWSSAKAVHISFPGQLSSLTAKGYRTTTQSETSAGVGMFCLAQNWQNWHERCGCLGKIQNFSSRSHVLTSSTQPKIWSIHVVAKPRTTKKCTKMQNARAELLFLLIKPIVLWRSRSHRCRSCVSSVQRSFKQRQQRRKRERHLKI